MSALFLQRAALPLRAAPGATRSRYEKNPKINTPSMVRIGPKILPRSSCGLKKSAGSKQQEIRPRKIARHRKLREEFVAEQPADGDDRADPDRPVPVAFHVDLAVAKRKIHRQST